MAPRTECGAHSLLIQNLESLKSGQEQLYNLDRGKASEMSEIKLSVVRLEESTKNGFSAIHEWQESFEKKQSERDATLQASMNKVLSMYASRRWSPKALIGLISAIVGPTGIAAVLVLFMK